MRWLKHLSTARNDEKLAEAVEQFGLEAYGFWWMLCEIIAEQMDDSDKCEAAYPLPTWARKFTISTRKTTVLMQKFAGINLILMEYDTTSGVGKLKIKIPKLLKYRDEYSKKLRTNSGQTPDKLRSKIEIEKQIEIEKIERDKKSRKGTKIFSPPTPQDVELYMAEISFDGNPQNFVDHYTARGWMIGKNKMKDWKAAVRTWRNNENGRRYNEIGGRGIASSAKTARGKAQSGRFIDANEAGTDWINGG